MAEIDGGYIPRCMCLEYSQGIGFYKYVLNCRVIDLTILCLKDQRLEELFND